MDTQTKKNLIQWIKRIVTTLLVALWIAIIIKIASLEVDFNQQATYCIFSTMIIFGVLIGIYQLIERYEGDLKG
ncbi:MAG: hypothetical protein KU38_07485 [Sulfurovum sp. FS08-3]|nr:MAG: hypothetical protein KU38_07485 [Sulfurovum sp. FS08-3]